MLSVLLLISLCAGGRSATLRTRRLAAPAGTPLAGDPVPCSLLAGLLSVNVSARCCFSVQVVMQRGLQEYGLAQPCKEAWSCEPDKMTVEKSFEDHALAQMCGEQPCMDGIVAAMRSNWMTANSADTVKNACNDHVSVEEGTRQGLWYARQHRRHNGTAADEPEDEDSDEKECLEYECPPGDEEKFYDYCVTGKEANKGSDCWDVCCNEEGSAGGGGGGGCFPGDALASVENGGLVQVGSLRAGHRVLAEGPGGLAYEEVLGFLHVLKGEALELVEAVHEHGVFRATPGHIVFVRDGDGRTDKTAVEIQVGDELLVAAEAPLTEWSRVISVSRKASSRDLYAPFTMSGTIIIDGVLASNYATPDIKVALSHRVAHAMLAPLRLYHWLGLAPREPAEACDPAESQEVLHPYLALLQHRLGLAALLPAASVSKL